MDPPLAVVRPVVNDQSVIFHAIEPATFDQCRDELGWFPRPVARMRNDRVIPSPHVSARGLFAAEVPQKHQVPDRQWARHSQCPHQGKELRMFEGFTLHDVTPPLASRIFFQHTPQKYFQV